MKYYEPECCPVCKRSDVKWRHFRKGFLLLKLQLELNRDSTIWRVCDCGTYFQFPMPTQESLVRFYEEGIYRGLWPTGGSSDRRAKMMMEIIREHEGETILDIGCGNGEVLARAKEEGWLASGVEPDPASRETAMAHGTVYKNIDEVPDNYDWVVMSHILEHVIDPISMLSDCAELLTDNGRLLVMVPYPTRMYGVDLTPSHTVMLPPNALRLVAEKANLNVLEIQEAKLETIMIAEKA